MLDKFRRLTWRDFLGITAAAAELCRVAITLRTVPFARLLDLLRLREPLPMAEDQTVDRVSRWVRLAHRIVPLKLNCLLDSLTTASLIRRQGFSVPLAIGVRKLDGKIQAHAWLGHAPDDSANGFRLLFRVPEEAFRLVPDLPAGPKT